jgi:hypothetical protein
MNVLVNGWKTKLPLANDGGRLHRVDGTLSVERVPRPSLGSGNRPEEIHQRRRPSDENPVFDPQ